VSACFAVVIPAYCISKRDYDLLERCLEGLKNQYWGDFYVVVVDDGSPPHFASENLRTSAPRRTVFLKHAQNQGRAVARNTGWQHSDADFILFLDADMYALPETLGSHFLFHQQQGPQWIAQGHIIGQQDPHVTPSESLWTDASQAFFATGHVSIAREALLKTCGFDPDFSAYGWEDLELGLRLKQQGYRQQKLKSAVSYHFEPPFCSEHWSQDCQKEQHRAEAAKVLLKKHPDAYRLCQASAFDSTLAHIISKGLPHDKILKKLERLQHHNAKLALALYRGLLHQEYVKALAHHLRP
jgi:glycosyltransferase involved in cell wall biosynthesis